MKILRAATASALLAAGMALSAQQPRLNIFYPDNRDFRSIEMSGVSNVAFSEDDETMTVSYSDGTAESFSLSAIDHFNIGHAVPQLRISTTDFFTDEIFSKETYLNANLDFIGNGLADDFSLPMLIRGRGNSTWGYPKKPYRIKFSAKQRMLMPAKAKNFVLLANYIDPSLMRNAAAFIFGDVIGMPWINHSYPVDVWLNDIYKGSYQLTEKVGFNNGSVNLKAADEPNSILFEFDVNDADEDEFPFETEPYDSTYGFCLSARIKDPDAPVDEFERGEWLASWQDDVNEFMITVDSRNYDDIFAACDLESLVRYVMVFNLACNQELNHPKSVFAYKTRGGKYHFGPCWDFDWAFGYYPTYKRGESSYQGWGQNYPSYQNPLLGPAKRQEGLSNDGYAGEFFHILCNNSIFLNRFREVWDDFYANGREEFLSRFDAYARLVEPSAALQAPQSSMAQTSTYGPTAIAELRQWIVDRIEFINSDPQMGLWDPDAYFWTDK